MSDSPSYYAIIPANVRYDKDLTANAKLLYGEITSLCNKTGICWAQNEYFSELYSVSKTSISKWISQLVEKGYVQNKLIYKEGTKQILKRYLTLLPYPIEEKLNSPIEEKLKDNSTSINNTINNKIEEGERFLDSELFKIPISEEEKSCAKKEEEKIIFDFFNETCVRLSKAQILNTERKKKISVLIKQVGIEKFKELIIEVSKSDFLNGDSERKWKANFDWILKPVNFTKILEGNYKNNEDAKPGPTKATRR